MSTASKGANFEREVIHMLRDNGYSCVRGAASKGHFDSPEGVVKADIIASKFGTKNAYELQIILIQCKVKKK